ncbi:DUF3306 domain-containing protein [Vibrio cincinnatiensis]|uniref:DUF3306 domain-containing protein n=1 Tax=Vibrio cincinnatiensis TaxID=675 RepID=UPI001EDCD132|nr:DUF3306 domain-containing protein [Vibrio cincinnatiensis]
MATDSFFHRWSKRKLHQKEDENLLLPLENDLSAPLHIEEDKAGEATEVQREHTSSPPSEETLSALLLSQASQEIKKSALRTLFFNGEFNERDRLDDYDDDYHNQTNLANELSQSLREWFDDSQTSTNTATQDPCDPPATYPREEKEDEDSSSVSLLSSNEGADGQNVT